MDALPLPPRPHLEQYRKLAKDLVKACRSSDPDAIRAWTTQWIETLAVTHGLTVTLPNRHLAYTPAEIRERVGRSVERIASRLPRGADAAAATCTLADAQLAI